MASTRGSLLIAAISGRSLARAASDAGYIPLIADFFADRDTQEIAYAVQKLPGDIRGGFQTQSLIAALQDLSQQAPAPILGVICGAGFEDRPHVLTRIAKDWPLIGNDAETVALVNDPRGFFARLEALAIPYPQTSFTPPSNPKNWLSKRAGGAGGRHVQPADDVPPRDGKTDIRSRYYQAFVPGRTISALFVANGRYARLLGMSEQWTAPTHVSPWRHGGAVQPAALEKQTTATIAERIAPIAAEFGLMGLCSADFIIGNGEIYLLEINPRPGGTLDIFANPESPLLTLHIDAALNGALPPSPLAVQGGAASTIVFAPDPITIPKAFAWPPWTADRPKPGERIDKTRPICTVLARAKSANTARTLVQERHTNLLAMIRKCVGEPGP